jgi:hypothetical protein
MQEYIQRIFVDKNSDQRNNGSNPHIKAELIGSNSSKRQNWQMNFHKTKGLGFWQSLETQANHIFE